jgi:YcxB-like protein
MNRIEVQLDAADHLAAQRLHTRWTRRQLLAHGCVVVVGALFLLVPSREHWTFIVGSGLIGGAIGGGLGRELVRRLWLPYRARRLFAQHKALHKPIEFEWDHEALSCRTESESGRTPWLDYARRREDRRVILLYPSDVIFQVIPRRCFTDAAQEQSFRERAARIVER